MFQYVRIKKLLYYNVFENFPVVIDVFTIAVINDSKSPILSFNNHVGTGFRHIQRHLSVHVLSDILVYFCVFCIEYLEGIAELHCSNLHIINSSA